MQPSDMTNGLGPAGINSEIAFLKKKRKAWRNQPSFCGDPQVSLISILCNYSFAISDFKFNYIFQIHVSIVEIGENFQASGILKQN